MAAGMFALEMRTFGALERDSHLAWRDGDEWVNAVSGNTAAGSLARAYQMSVQEFLRITNGGTFDPVQMLGAWGRTSLRERSGP